jgi:hypothetical protein
LVQLTAIMTQASDNHASPHSRDGRSAGLLGIQRAAAPCRSDVPLRRVRADEVRVRTFSTNSRPALRAAASGGRPRPATTPRGPGNRAHPVHTAIYGLLGSTAFVLFKPSIPNTM